MVESDRVGAGGSLDLGEPGIVFTVDDVRTVVERPEPPHPPSEPT